MKVLLLRLSSLGDVLHTLPALTDLARAHPDLELDWLIEPAFAPVAQWHPMVRQVLPFSLRDRRQGKKILLQKILALRAQLHSRNYDLVLDSQGLYKSAILARLAGAPVLGLAPRSAREPLSTLLYQQRFRVPWGPTAIQRNRELFAKALSYPRPSGPADFGLAALAKKWREEPASLPAFLARPFVIAFHATSKAWQNKEWPIQHWITLAHTLADDGFALLLPAIDARERHRVESIARAAPNVQGLPAMDLAELARIMVRARAFVGMDTGLSYLAVALGLPGVTLYGPTAPELDPHPWNAGPMIVPLSSQESCAPCGQSHCRRISRSDQGIPCQESLLPETVWQQLRPLLKIDAHELP